MTLKIPLNAASVACGRGPSLCAVDKWVLREGSCRKVSVLSVAVAALRCDLTNAFVGHGPGGP